MADKKPQSSGIPKHILDKHKGKRVVDAKTAASERIGKLDPDLVLKAKRDLKEVMGREPTPQEVSRFLQDMPRSPLYTPQRRQLANEKADQNKSQHKTWSKVDAKQVKAAQHDLKVKLGREPTSQEMSKYLADLEKAKKIPPSTGGNKVKEAVAKTSQNVNKAMANVANQAKAKLEAKSNIPQDKAKLEAKDAVEKVSKDVNSKIANVMKDAKIKAHQGKTGKNWKPVDPAIVKDVQKDLREVLGRDPTPKEVEQFLEDMQAPPPKSEKANHQNSKFKIDKTIIAEARADLKELLGRNPTEKEVNDFLKDIQDEDPVDAEQFRKPTLSSPLASNRANVPKRAYTAEDAIAKLKNQGNKDPTDQQINDWLFDHNEPLVGEVGFEDVDLPGITSTYTSNQFDVFSSTNVIVLLLVLFLSGLFYKMRKKKNEDEYVKVDDNGNGIFEKMLNPFNRKNNKDDDFDKFT